jgi:hypothetical protein
MRSMQESAGPGWPWPWPVDPTLAFVNEPPLGGPGCNVAVENGASTDELLYIALTTILPAQELFVDYGLKYDRSHYGPAEDAPQSENVSSCE